MHSVVAMLAASTVSGAIGATGQYTRNCTGMSRGEPTAPIDRTRTVSLYVPSTSVPTPAISRTDVDPPGGTVTVSGVTLSQVAPWRMARRAPRVTAPESLMVRMTEGLSLELRRPESMNAVVTAMSTGGATVAVAAPVVASCWAVIPVGPESLAVASPVTESIASRVLFEGRHNTCGWATRLSLMSGPVAGNRSVTPIADNVGAAGATVSDFS